MTRLPVDSWDVRPRLDIPPYQLNHVCPVTGEAEGLEDHHIFRRSFTALSREEGERLYWVEVRDYVSDIAFKEHLVKNRVALSPGAHRRITENRARLEYRQDELWYIEGGEEKHLNLNLRLMEGSEKVSKPRKRAETPEEKRAKVNYSFRPPAGEPNMMPELVEQAREKFAKQTGTPNTEKAIPPYKLITAILYHYITS